MKERHKIIPASFLILRKEGKILLSLRQNTGWSDGLYSLPSGHLEPGEMAKSAMVREAQEEIGVHIKLEDLHLVLTMMIITDSERVNFFFIADAWEGEIANMELEKCGGLDWYALDSLPDNVVPYVRKALEYIKEGKPYLEYENSGV